MEAESSGARAKARPQAWLQADISGKGRILGAQVAAGQRSESTVSSQEHTEGLRRGVAALSSRLPSSIMQRIAAGTRGHARASPSTRVHYVSCPDDVLECTVEALENGECEGNTSDKGAEVLDRLDNLVSYFWAFADSLIDVQKVSGGVWYMVSAVGVCARRVGFLICAVWSEGLRESCEDTW